MRAFNNILVFMFATWLVFSGCEHLNFPSEEQELQRWRISKISSNKNFENSKVFEYNSKGLLTRFSPENTDSPLYFIYDIEYDRENKPVIVTESMHLSGNITVKITKIEWSKNAFKLIQDNEILEEYKLDEQNRVVEISNKKSFSWIGTDSLFVEAIASDKFEKFKFVKINHHLSGINIAVVLAAKLNLCDWQEWQNKYCISTWEKCDECSGKIFYTTNEWNYPTEMRKRIESKYGVSYHTLYFEYESY